MKTAMQMLDEAATAEQLKSLHAQALRSLLELARPSAIHKPTLSLDGNRWCALLGENLQIGVAGFGRSPAAAMLAFDREWPKEKPL